MLLAIFRFDEGRAINSFDFFNHLSVEKNDEIKKNPCLVDVNKTHTAPVSFHMSIYHDQDK